ncbi:hypothetical protein [Absidia glauca]|uniref:C2H2-type domain-containing protein n=1 Tax=Absidia glauca TaxID=4829 RepID=A0A163TIR1_ABSGL|nr:hypothetical protein [Absidia glauca]
MWPALIRGSVFSSIRSSALLPSGIPSDDTLSNLSKTTHIGTADLKHPTSNDSNSTGAYNLNNWMKNSTPARNESTPSLPATYRCEMLSIEELTTDNRSQFTIPTLDTPWLTTGPSRLFPAPENHPGPSTPDNDTNIDEDDMSDSSDGVKDRPTTTNRSSTTKDSHLLSTTKKKHTKNPGDRPYACALCDRRFNRRYNLNAHIRTHDPLRIRLFDCPSCNQSFDRKHDRDRHMDALHYARKRRYICQLCDASFSRRDALARHCHKQHTPSMYI